jgi:hypothetical protein
MKHDRFWKMLSVCFLAAMIYIGHGLHVLTGADGPSFGNSALAAGVGTPSDQTEVVLTSSENGRTIYIWQYNHARPPRFLGQSTTNR